MPMKLNVGVSRKVGLPDYGSVGASCNLELELESTLLERDLQAFHNQIRGAYVVVHQAVHNELARLQSLADSKAEAPAWTSGRGASANGQAGESRNGQSRWFQEAPSRGRKPATPNQVKAIRAIARSQDTDLESLLRHECDAGRPDRPAEEYVEKLIGPDRRTWNSSVQASGPIIPIPVVTSTAGTCRDSAALPSGGRRAGLACWPRDVSTGGATIEYETHSMFVNFCTVVLLSGFVLFLLGEGWIPVITSVLAVIVLAAWVGRLRRGGL